MRGPEHEGCSRDTAETRESEGDPSLARQPKRALRRAEMSNKISCTFIDLRYTQKYVHFRNAQLNEFDKQNTPTEPTPRSRNRV